MRLAFAAKEVDFQRVEMDMRERSQWHMNENKGVIPLLEMPDGTMIHESRVLMELANDLGKDHGY